MGFIFIPSPGPVEASHLQIKLRGAAFGVKSYEDMHKSFRQINLYIVAEQKGIKGNMFHMDVSGLMFVSVAPIVFQSSEVSHFC